MTNELRPSKLMLSLSLRARLIMAIVVLVTLISSVFALAVWELKVRIEAVAFGHMAEDQLNLILSETDDPATADTRLLHNWQLYAGELLDNMPEAFASLAPGSHHSVRVNERYFQVQVNEHDGSKAVLIYDITDWENQEHWVLFMLGVGALCVLFIAIVVAVKASVAVLLPLRLLTERIADIQPQQRGIRLSPDFPENEVGRIAHAVDSYLERLDGFVSREKYFTTAASHELRTPLSVVTGAVEVLESQMVDDGDDKLSLRAINRIKRACQDMLGFIEVSLLLSREEAQPLQSPEGTDVVGLVHHLVDELKPQLQEKHIDVTINAGSQLQLAQPQSLVQIVISNLLRNAMEHTDSGHITVDINKNSLSICDTGSGIAPENLQRVFERSYTTKSQGTGLGLNLVHRLCERLSWQIDLQSTLGKGTCVRLTFHR